MAQTEVVALVLSGFAAVLSTITFIRKERVDRLAIQKQLTETVQKLAELNAETAKFFALPPEDRAKLPPRYVRILHDQRRVFARQADLLAEELDGRLTSYESLVIAGAFADIEDYERAERHFAAARNTSDVIDYCIACRRYAAYLFAAGNLAGGRAWFEHAAKSVEGDTDRLVSYRADTLERWAIEEQRWCEFDAAVELLAAAKTDYDRLQHPRKREDEGARIERMMREWSSDRATSHDG